MSSGFTIYDLPLKTTPASTDEIEIQETNNGTSKKVTIGSLPFQAQLGFTPVNKAGDQMTGMLRNKAVASIASAATLDLTTADANLITQITGTTTVTAVTMPAGAKVDAIAGGAFTLQNGASLVVAGGANYTCAVGDRLTFISFDGTKVYVWIEKASGQAVVGVGKVLQVVTNYQPGGNNITTSTTDVPFGPNVVITPQSSTNRILILHTGTVYQSSGSQTEWAYKIYRDTTDLAADGHVGLQLNAGDAVPLALHIIDSPATTNAVTYGPYAHRIGTGTGTLISGMRASQNQIITAMEIAS